MQVWLWQGIALLMCSAMILVHGWVFGAGDLRVGLQSWRGMFVVYVVLAFGVAEMMARRAKR